MKARRNSPEIDGDTGGGSEVRGALRTPGARAQVEQEAEERYKKGDTKLSIVVTAPPSFALDQL